MECYQKLQFMLLKLMGFTRDTSSATAAQETETVYLCVYDFPGISIQLIIANSFFHR